MPHKPTIISVTRFVLPLILLGELSVFSPSLLALDPNKRITQYDIRLFQAEHGLPMNDMKVVFQDSKGYIWLGCQEGLVRFDGVRFVLFDKSKYPGLHENFIWDIKEDWEGNLWLATNGGGVSRFDGHSFTTFDTSDGLPSNVVYCILISKDRTIWFGTENGVAHLKNHFFTNYKFSGLVDNQRIVSLLDDENGNLLVGRRYPGLDVISSDSLYNLPIVNYEVGCMFKRTNGDIILGMGNARLYIYRNGRIRKFDPFQLPTNHTISAIHEDSDGNLWFCTDGNGIIRYSKGRFDNLKSETGLPQEHDYFVRVLEDREKNLWFIGDGGLLQLKDNKFIVFGRNEGSVSNFGLTVCQDHLGNIWAGFRQGWLVKFGQYSTRVFGREHGFASNEVTSVIPSQNDGLWINTGNDLYRMKNERLRRYSRSSIAGKYAILSLYENTRGDLWVGIALGYLSHFDGKRFYDYRLTNSYAESGNVTCVLEMANGDVWAGTWKQGLYRLRNGNIYRFSEKDGFAADGVNAFYEDDEQTLWIATDGNGLYRYKNGKFANINSGHDLYFDRLFSILEDDQHNLWFSGNRGIFQANKQQLNNVADGAAVAVNCQSYNYLDGMRQTECNGRRQRVAWKSRDGRLWFVSTAGVVSVDPNNMPINKVIPPIYVEEITANQERTISPDSALISLKAYERELAIRYTALSFAIPERVYFKYKLEGYDHDWVEAGTRRTAFYTNIPKGDYTFHVIACNNDSLWNEKGATVKFSIAPFWWETWWAYSLYVLAFGLLLYGLRRYEMKRVRLRNELKLEHVRSERLQELDHLKSRFFAGISHEFRTPLTLIGGPLHDMLEKSRDDQEKPQIEMMLRNTQRLQRLVDQLLDLAQLESGKMTLQARPVPLLPFLQGLVAAFESHAQQKNIRLTLNVDESLNGETVYLDADKMEKVIINLIANALKYTPSDGAVEVAVRSAEGLERRAEGEEQSARLLAISVRDNGSGIPAHILPHVFDYFYRYQQKDNRQEAGSGIGLALARELVELHHGRISVVSYEGAGSEFTITLPLGKAHLKPKEIAGETLAEDFTVSHAPLMPELPGDDENQEQVTKIDDQKKMAAKILLVEDNADMRRYLREHLQPQWQLLEATDGEAGLQRALAEIPDLIISDVMMPKMDGFELCRKLKTNEMTSHIPLILLTARGSGESKLEGLELGADEYLTKPLVAHELRLRVRNLIEQQWKLRRRISQEIATPEMQLSSLKISSADEKFLQRATTVLEEHLDDSDFDPEALAAAMTISRVHLNRKLRGLLGLRTSDFIRNLRLKRAAELLRVQSGTVSEIAYQVGFNHLSYFARCFKEQYGKLPSEYAQD